MCKDDLTYNIAAEALRNFFREKPFVFFGTGMSCALDNRFGMDALRDELLCQMNGHSLKRTQQEEWDRVMQSLRSGTDLESALDGVSDYALLQKITAITGCFVASVDREYAFRIANGEIEWPATHFLKRLVGGLPEGDRILHVLTPNYDMLFEYACDHSGIPYTNGFVGGVERRIDWDAVERALLSPERVYQRGKMKPTYKNRKHVRLYKVHGSLNYFFHQGVVIENNAWMWNPPDFAQRVMITPGLSKYETLQRYRQELLSKADIAIEREHHFLFLGYGFNDKHIEEYIKRKLVNQGCAGLIITRDSNPRIESLLLQAANLWLVCKSQEANSNGTRIFNKMYANWLSIPEKVLWDISQFTKEILGG
ncbi:MAG: hypothetical protein D9V47_05580 [Clostridia bacterium]|nr:MAG: hypothetical protein D9V47_05580 [Clostridia bacterium]